MIVTVYTSPIAALLVDRSLEQSHHATSCSAAAAFSSGVHYKGAAARPFLQRLCTCCFNRFQTVPQHAAAAVAHNCCIGRYAFHKRLPRNIPQRLTHNHGDALHGIITSQQLQWLLHHLVKLRHKIHLVHRQLRVKDRVGRCEQPERRTLHRLAPRAGARSDLQKRRDLNKMAHDLDTLVERQGDCDMV